VAYRILSLDGGGTFCLIQARALAELYPGQSGHQLLRNFDLVAACSGGSFVAAALFADKSPTDILELFRSQRLRERFFRPRGWQQRLKHSWLAQFDTHSKADLIREVTGEAGEKTMGQLRAPGLPDLLIVGYDFQYDKAKLFRSRADSAGANFPRSASRLRLRDAVSASTHAPLRWFSGVARPEGGDHFGYWDGAMTGFNNPVLLATAEALANGAKREDVRALSIGTSCTELLPADTRCDPALKVGTPRSGFFSDLVKAGRAIVGEPPDADTYLAHICLSSQVPREEGHRIPSPIVRLNPVVHPCRAGQHWAPPARFTHESFGRLVRLDISATEDAEVALLDGLCASWIGGETHNQSVRRRGDYFGLNEGGSWNEALCCEIGDLRFADAAQRWHGVQEPAREVAVA